MLAPFINAIVFRAVCDVNSFINSESGNLSEIVVGMCADGADAIRRKAEVRRVLPIDLAEFLFTFHSWFLISLMKSISSSIPYTIPQRRGAPPEFRSSA